MKPVPCTFQGGGALRAVKFWIRSLPQIVKTAMSRLSDDLAKNLPRSLGRNFTANNLLSRSFLIFLKRPLLSFFLGKNLRNDVVFDGVQQHVGAREFKGCF